MGITLFISKGFLKKENMFLLDICKDNKLEGESFIRAKSLIKEKIAKSKYKNKLKDIIIHVEAHKVAFIK